MITKLNGRNITKFFLFTIKFMETPKIELYLGTVHEVKDRQTYEITADIPGVAQEVRAYPFSRGDMDEPVSGNVIYLMSVDPVYHSFFLYTKAKENDFVGIRSNGKSIDITPGAITIGVYDTSKTSKDDTRPDPSKSFVKMDDSGNIEINATGNEKVTISGNAEISVSGDANIKVSGTTDVDGAILNINSGTINMNGKVPAPGSGPFNCITNCIFSGCVHGSNTAQ